MNFLIDITIHNNKCFGWSICELINTDHNFSIIILNFNILKKWYNLFENHLTEEYNIKDLYFANIGSAICSHTGPGVIAISCI